MAFTYQYSQPQDYQFSLDSVELAARISRVLNVGSSNRELTMLDLCAGCGVVGWELDYHLRQPVGANGEEARPPFAAMDFLEVQSVYRAHFEFNRTLVGRPEAQWVEKNYRELLGPLWENRYDLIVSNPPYFEQGQGPLPPSEFKARCRFFLDSDFATMWRAIAHALKPGGEAFVLMRERSDLELAAILLGLGEWRYLDPVRGTDLLYFRKHARP